ENLLIHMALVVEILITAYRKAGLEGTVVALNLEPFRLVGLRDGHLYFTDLVEFNLLFHPPAGSGFLSDSHRFFHLGYDTVRPDTRPVMKLELGSMFTHRVGQPRHDARYPLGSRADRFGHGRSESGDPGSILQGDKTFVSLEPRINQRFVQRLGKPHVIVADRNPLLLQPLRGLCNILADRSETQYGHLLSLPQADSFSDLHPPKLLPVLHARGLTSRVADGPGRLLMTGRCEHHVPQILLI